MRETAGEQRREGGGFGSVEMGEEQGFARDAERVGHQQFGIEARRLADGGEVGGSRSEGASHSPPACGRGWGRGCHICSDGTLVALPSPSPSREREGSK
ncbi:hypothetical protein GCM10011395_16130 [Sphingomonas psychrolutea]|uniref:Uncharacterized protein n=1 Tax=Sphingomonas psychrolutea TaxID=1259676 RepID=A0ABQ1GMN0_9SPHN|nr:hypothetical protein GCM10011395_16130 [Sphingomonas psychrolutea]